MGLPVIFISAAKFILLIGALLLFIFEWRTRQRPSPYADLWLPVAILVALAAMALSALWTAAPDEQAA
ncbi:MAG: hypothetical protein RLZ81_2517, partial [Pseudomonadota bacterium]